MKSNFPASEKGHFECEFCHKRFDYFQYLRNHQETRDECPRWDTRNGGRKSELMGQSNNEGEGPSTSRFNGRPYSYRRERENGGGPPPRRRTRSRSNSKSQSGSRAASVERPASYQSKSTTRRSRSRSRTRSRSPHTPVRRDFHVERERNGGERERMGHERERTGGYRHRGGSRSDPPPSNAPSARLRRADGKMIETFYCDFCCERVFKQYEELYEHKTQVCDQRDRYLYDKYFICKYCSRPALSMAELQAHFRAVH